MIRGAFQMGCVDWHNAPCYLPVVQSVEWAMQLEFVAGLLGEPFDFAVALEISAEDVIEYREAIARIMAGRQAAVKP